MGLATINPHSQNVQTKLYKIPMFVVDPTRPKRLDPTVSKIQPFENVKIYQEMFGHVITSLE